MKRPSSLLAALGAAIAVHAGGLVAWVNVKGSGPVKPAQAQQAQRARLLALSWRWEQAPTATPTPGHKEVAGPPASAQVEWVLSAPDRDADAPAEALATGAADASDTAAHFWPASELDFRALPLQAPDPAPLHGIDWAADHPMRLRLSITAQGEVVDVAPVDAEPPPPHVLAALTAMFKATPFMPARRRGADVASLQTIEVSP